MTRVWVALCFYWACILSGWAQKQSETTIRLAVVNPEKTVTDTVPCFVYLVRPTEFRSYTNNLRIVVSCGQFPDQYPSNILINGTKIPCSRFFQRDDQMGMEGISFSYEYAFQTNNFGEFTVTVSGLVFQGVHYHVEQPFFLSFSGENQINRRSPASDHQSSWFSKFMESKFFSWFLYGVLIVVIMLFSRLGGFILASRLQGSLARTVLASHRLPLTSREASNYYDTFFAFLFFSILFFLGSMATTDADDQFAYRLVYIIFGTIAFVIFLIRYHALRFRKIRSSLSVSKLRDVFVELSQINNWKIVPSDEESMVFHAEADSNKTDYFKQITIVFDQPDVWVNCIKNPHCVSRRALFGLFMSRASYYEIIEESVRDYEESEKKLDS